MERFLDQGPNLVLVDRLDPNLRVCFWDRASKKNLGKFINLEPTASYGELQWADLEFGVGQRVGVADRFVEVVINDLRSTRDGQGCIITKKTAKR